MNPQNKPHSSQEGVVCDLVVGRASIFSEISRPVSSGDHETDDVARCIYGPRCSSQISFSVYTGSENTAEMSGRARVPVGAMERGELFGNPPSARSAPSSEADFQNKDIRGGDVPRAVSRQQQPQQPGAGSASATPYGVLSPGRRRYVCFLTGRKNARGLPTECSRSQEKLPRQHY